ncbi:catabolic L-serine/threonine dehydratase [Cryptotrichosporon argae]
MAAPQTTRSAPLRAPPNVAPWIETPLVESAALSRVAKCRIFLKLENLQPSGSFKSRGIGNFVIKAAASRSNPTFYISSGGNAGLACVVAARALGHPCVVAVPTTCKPAMIAKLYAVGAAEVVQHGANWAECDTFLRVEVMKDTEEGVYVHPFDHEDVWDGASSMVDEIAAQLRAAGVERADAVVCSVGGGGLFSGIVRGLERAGMADTRVVAVETEGAASLHASVRAGELVTLPAITSIATSLGATRVAAQAYASARRANVATATVSDAEAARACVAFADDERALVEPACGATLALAYGDRLRALVPNLKEDGVVVLVVCGGSNVSLRVLEEYRATYGEA